MEREKEEVDWSKNILTSSEAARYLGVSLSTLYKWTMGRVLPYSKPNGGRCYFDRSELEKWCMSNRISTADELNQQAQAYCAGKGGRR